MAEFEKPWPRYPRCLIINEIGAICNEDGKDAKKAEEFLRCLLESKDQDDRFYAFCWLSVISNLDPQTVQKVEEFKQNPDNQEIITKTKDQIENFKRKL